jgi:hypothetical protein
VTDDELRIIRRHQRATIAIDSLKARLAKVEQEAPDSDWQYASGDAVCESCGLELRQHPEHPGVPYLNIRCDGSLVKL